MVATGESDEVHLGRQIVDGREWVVDSGVSLSPTITAVCLPPYLDQEELFAALRRTKLMMTSPSDALYSRCGRTDKGVNAHCQVDPSSSLPSHGAIIA